MAHGLRLPIGSPPVVQPSTRVWLRGTSFSVPAEIGCGSAVAAGAAVAAAASGAAVAASGAAVAAAGAASVAAGAAPAAVAAGAAGAWVAAGAAACPPHAASTIVVSARAASHLNLIILIIMYVSSNG